MARSTVLPTAIFDRRELVRTCPDFGQLRIEPLVHAAKADDGVARALVVKRNPVIEAEKAHRRAEGRQAGLTEGRREALAKALLDVLVARDVPLALADRARILGERDPQRLERWSGRAMRGASLADVLDEP